MVSEVSGITVLLIIMRGLFFIFFRFFPISIITFFMNFRFISPLGNEGVLTVMNIKSELLTANSRSFDTVYDFFCAELRIFFNFGS